MDSTNGPALRKVPGLFGQTSPRKNDMYEDMSGAKAPRISRTEAFSPTGTALTGSATAWTKSFKISTQVKERQCHFYYELAS